MKRYGVARINLHNYAVNPLLSPFQTHFERVGVRTTETGRLFEMGGLQYLTKQKPWYQFSMKKLPVGE